MSVFLEELLEEITAEAERNNYDQSSIASISEMALSWIQLLCAAVSAGIPVDQIEELESCRSSVVGVPPKTVIALLQSQYCCPKFEDIVDDLTDLCANYVKVRESHSEFASKLDEACASNDRDYAKFLCEIFAETDFDDGITDDELFKKLIEQCSSDYHPSREAIACGHLASSEKGGHQ
jgi:hypothetical protein